MEAAQSSPSMGVLTAPSVPVLLAREAYARRGRIGEDRSVETTDASACFDGLLAFADDRGDHLLAALLTEAWSHFVANHRAAAEDGHDAP